MLIALPTAVSGFLWPIILLISTGTVLLLGVLVSQNSGSRLPAIVAEFCSIRELGSTVDAIHKISPLYVK